MPDLEPGQPDAETQAATPEQQAVQTSSPQSGSRPSGPVGRKIGQVEALHSGLRERDYEQGADWVAPDGSGQESLRPSAQRSAQEPSAALETSAGGAPSKQDKAQPVLESAQAPLTKEELDNANVTLSNQSDATSQLQSVMSAQMAKIPATSDPWNIDFALSVGLKFVVAIGGVARAEVAFRLKGQLGLERTAARATVSSAAYSLEAQGSIDVHVCALIQARFELSGSWTNSSIETWESVPDFMDARVLGCLDWARRSHPTRPKPTSSGNNQTTHYQVLVAVNPNKDELLSSAKEWTVEDVERLFALPPSKLPKSYAALGRFRSHPELLASILNLYSNESIKDKGDQRASSSDGSTVNSSSTGKARANVDINDSHLFAVLYSHADTTMYRERQVEGHAERTVGKRSDSILAGKFGPLQLSILDYSTSNNSNAHDDGTYREVRIEINLDQIQGIFGNVISTAGLSGSDSAQLLAQFEGSLVVLASEEPAEVIAKLGALAKLAPPESFMKTRAGALLKKIEGKVFFQWNFAGGNTFEVDSTSGDAMGALKAIGEKLRLVNTQFGIELGLNADVSVPLSAGQGAQLTGAIGVSGNVVLADITHADAAPDYVFYKYAALVKDKGGPGAWEQWARANIRALFQMRDSIRQIDLSGQTNKELLYFVDYLDLNATDIEAAKSSALESGDGVVAWVSALMKRRLDKNPQDANYKPAREAESIRSQAERLIKRESQFKSAWPSDPIHIAEMGVFAFEMGNTSNPFKVWHTREDGWTIYFWRNFCRLLPKKAPKGSLSTIISHMSTLNGDVTEDAIVQGAAEKEEWRIAFYHALHGTGAKIETAGDQADELPAEEQSRIATEHRLDVLATIAQHQEKGRDQEAKSYAATLESENAHAIIGFVAGRHWEQLDQVVTKGSFDDRRLLRILADAGAGAGALQRSWLLHERMSRLNLRYLSDIHHALTDDTKHWFVKYICNCVGFGDVDLPYEAMRRCDEKRAAYRFQEAAQQKAAILRRFALVFANLGRLEDCCWLILPDGHREVLRKIKYLQRSV